MATAPEAAGTKEPADQLTTVPAGDYVFREGELGTEMYVVHEGAVEILREAAGGDRRIALMEKGDFFGEMSLIEELPRTASARAVRDARLIRIGGSLFDRMLRENPEIAVRIIRKLSRRVRETEGRLRRALEGEPSAATGPAAAGAVARRDGERQAPGAVLVHPGTGLRLTFDLDVPVTIGRADPVTRIQPEVDLTAVDDERSCSRRHATLRWEDGHSTLVEEIGTLNGTFVNGDRLETAVPAPVRSGDLLRFGLVELELLVDAADD